MLRPGGMTGFTTMAVAPGLSKERHRRAVRWGPRAVASTRPIDALVAAAGFVDVEVIDVSEEFHSAAIGWVAGWARHEDEVRPLLGELFDERMTHYKEMIAGAEQGLLRRLLLIATAPA